jgi:hypothetical protein
MSECRILCLKPVLQLEWRSQDGQDETQKRNHVALTLGNSFGQSMRVRFSVHTGGKIQSLSHFFNEAIQLHSECVPSVDFSH